MKKRLLNCILCAFSITVAAQTSDNPLPLVVGENEFTFPAVADESVYYRYIPASDEMITVSSDIRAFYLSVEEDGIPVGTMYNWFNESSTENIFIALKDREYTVVIEASETDGYTAGSKMTFEVSSEPWNRNTAMSCESPLYLGTAPAFMPIKGMVDGQPGYTYASYTPTKDCTLEIITDWYPWSIECTTDIEEPTWVNIPVQTSISALGAYRWLVNVDKDTHYTFRVSGSCSTKIWVKESEYIIGESCEVPFEGVIGMNRLPAAAGTYYFAVTAPATDQDAPDNFIEIKSSASLDGGSITLSRWCGDTDYAYTVFDNFALRKSVISKQPCIITIVKTHDTPKEEYFEIKFSSPQPYDDFYTGYTVLSDVEITTPEYPGTYYYMVEPVMEKGMILTIDSEYQPKSNVSVMLSDRSLGARYVAKGETSLRYTELSPGVSYIVTWTTTDKDCSVPFTISIRKGAQGETAYWPFDAVAGENIMTAGEQQYYRFTGTADGWLNIYPVAGCSEPSVKMLRDDDYNPRCIVFPTENGYRVSNYKDRQFTIKFPEVAEGARFSLVETEYGDGECMANAIETDGEIDLCAGPGVYWYKYSPTTDLNITLTTDLMQAFGQGGLEGLISGYTLYRNSQDNYLQPQVDWITGVISPLNFIASAGDTYYLEIRLVNKDNDVSFWFGSENIKPGEHPDNPIVIENQGNPTEYEFPEQEYSSNGGIWYLMHLYPGELHMKADGSIKIEVYPADNTGNEAMIANSGYLSYDLDEDITYYGFGNGNEFYPAGVVESEGDYLFKLRWSEPVKAVFSGQALAKSDGVDDILLSESDVRVFVSGHTIVVTGDTDAKVYRIDGTLVGDIVVRGTATLPVAPGAYIVVAGGKAVKTAVR